MQDEQPNEPETNTDAPAEDATTGQPAAADAGRMVYRNLALYVLVRVVLVGAVTVLLMFLGVPLLIALAVGLVLGFPLAMLLFRDLGARVAAGLAAKGAAREAQRQRLRAQLRGERPET